MILQDGTTSNLQGEKSRMVEPKISLCVCVCCFSDVFGWYLELETSILNGCLVKPFLKSRFKKSFNWSKHWHKWLFKVPGCHLREATKKHDSFFSKKNNGMSTRVDKSTLSSDFWTVQKVVFSQKKNRKWSVNSSSLPNFHESIGPFLQSEKLGWLNYYCWWLWDV